MTVGVKVALTFAYPLTVGFHEHVAVNGADAAVAIDTQFPIFLPLAKKVTRPIEFPVADKLVAMPL